LAAFFGLILALKTNKQGETKSSQNKKAIPSLKSGSYFRFSSFLNLVALLQTLKNVNKQTM
jgi:hypothetical protein